MVSISIWCIFQQIDWGIRWRLHFTSRLYELPFGIVCSIANWDVDYTFKRYTYFLLNLENQSQSRILCLARWRRQNISELRRRKKYFWPSRTLEWIANKKACDAYIPAKPYRRFHSSTHEIWSRNISKDKAAKALWERRIQVSGDISSNWYSNKLMNDNLGRAYMVQKQ